MKTQQAAPKLGATIRKHALITTPDVRSGVMFTCR